jgi:hypothetical protein
MALSTFLVALWQVLSVCRLFVLARSILIFERVLLFALPSPYLFHPETLANDSFSL